VQGLVTSDCDILGVAIGSSAGERAFASVGMQLWPRKIPHISTNAQTVLPIEIPVDHRDLS
jgi:hypothetical protein